MRLWVEAQGEVVLGRRDFVAQGGQASVYAKAGVAYKLYADPAAVLPAGKLRELAAITDEAVVKPERFVSAPTGGRPIGYAMRHVARAYTLCQLVPRSFRERHGVSPEIAFQLVRRLQRHVVNIHQAGALVVDLSDRNVLAAPTFDQIYCIDVDSYQTAHYPATALTPSIRDWLAPNGNWSELSDWFSFAVVTFQLLIGVHPYRGTHDRVPDLEDRMRNGLSVFDPDVRIPRVCYPFDVIPPGYRDWYRAVLQDGKRLPPPREPGGAIALAPGRPVGPGTQVRLTELAHYTGSILGVYAGAGQRLVRTDRGFWLGGQRVADAVGGAVGVGRSVRRGRPVLATLQGGLRVVDLASGTGLALAAHADELMSCDGRIYLRSHDKILGLVLTDVGPSVIAAVHHVADVLPHATHLFDGLALQNLLGASYAMIMPAAGRCHAVRLAELDGCHVVDAKFDGGVLMAIRAQAGRYDRLVFRFDPSFRTYDCRVVRHVLPAVLNFVTLDTGVCACLADDDRLEVFSNRTGSTALRQVDDDALGADLTLCREPGRVLCHRGGELLHLSLR